ncbi:MAG: VOC family protein [Chloroflexi bacterium]|nr:VOC family protein [Chloroflexota bacterium]
MESPELHLTDIGQIAITARNIERAVAFYRDALGMEFLFQAPPSLAFFNCSGLRLMLAVPDAPTKETTATIYFRVPDIESAHTTLLERGVHFLREPHLIAKMPDHDLWMAFFEDSEGNMLALMEERKAHPTAH